MSAGICSDLMIDRGLQGEREREREREIRFLENLV
jgi:hypothetical protein